MRTRGNGGCSPQSGRVPWKLGFFGFTLPTTDLRLIGYDKLWHLISEPNQKLFSRRVWESSQPSGFTHALPVPRFRTKSNAPKWSGASHPASPPRAPYRLPFHAPPTPFKHRQPPGNPAGTFSFQRRPCTTGERWQGPVLPFLPLPL